PAPVRDQSRLMVVNRETGSIEHDLFSNLPRYLAGRPLMAFNNARVIPARLTGWNKASGKLVELLLVREIDPKTWEVLAKGLAKLKEGSEFAFGDGGLTAVLTAKRDGRGIFQFSCDGDLSAALSQAGRAPLPPYIHRPPSSTMDSLDRERYQTVYAKTPGAIAAPTAGLHFTDYLLENIRSNYAEAVFLTLQVGAGTFQPIRTEEVVSHRMEKEFYRIPKDTWNRLADARANHRTILSVGTTTTRVLETASFSSPTQTDITGWADCFIYPGYEFKTAGQLLTNFHLPKSTLFLLVCAFAGKALMDRAYQAAVEGKYRFFSYGDAMFIR
ncbi:MAG: tRNA preQ1(34) S-adenosylmethionine ribosyltransferase-isomerase QueA, partial [Nitrospinales bacterium]